MNSNRDPEGYEAKSLLRSSSFSGKQVLEIGCGSGWLTWQYANQAAKVMGIDPSLEDLGEEKKDRAASITNFSAAQAMGEALPFPSGQFDVVVFSNSL